MLVESPSDVQLKRLYREAAVHCVTSTMEGFGMTILESMAQGTPAVVSSIGVFKEICGDSGLYFNEDQPEDLASKLMDVLGAVNYKDLSLSALSQASRFSWNKSASKLSSAYSKIL
jgi:glycosyltransferase involved in cell wall biosynthesis